MNHAKSRECGEKNRLLDQRLPENARATRIIEAAIEVHKLLRDPGLSESIYEEALAYELELRGMKVVQQVELPVTYMGRALSVPMKMDLVVEGLVVVCKAAARGHEVFEAQLLKYLRLSKLRLGLVMNFELPLVRDGIQRLVYGL